MKIDGVVCGYHARLPRYAIRTAHGYAVVDVEVGELAVHDQVNGTLEDHGQVVLINRTTGENVEVCVEAVHANRATAEALLQSK